MRGLSCHFRRDKIIATIEPQSYWSSIGLLVFLKIFKCLAFSDIYKISGWLDLLFKALHQERKRRNERILTTLALTPLVCGRSPLIYRHLIYRSFIKILIIMSISTNIHRPYVCDPLSPYISLVHNSIDQITSYWPTLINYPFQHIY